MTSAAKFFCSRWNIREKNDLGTLKYSLCWFLSTIGSAVVMVAFFGLCLYHTNRNLAPFTISSTKLTTLNGSRGAGGVASRSGTIRGDDAAADPKRAVVIPVYGQERKSLLADDGNDDWFDSGTSHVPTVTWLDFYCVVSFYATQKSKWAGWRHCRHQIMWLDFYCVVSFYAIQKSKWAGWRHCRHQVTWLDFYCVVSFYAIQKSEWAGWRQWRHQVTWLLGHERFYCIGFFYRALLKDCHCLYFNANARFFKTISIIHLHVCFFQRKK